MNEYSKHCTSILIMPWILCEKKTIESNVNTRLLHWSNGNTIGSLTLMLIWVVFLSVTQSFECIFGDCVCSGAETPGPPGPRCNWSDLGGKLRSSEVMGGLLLLSLQACPHSTPLGQPFPPRTGNCRASALLSQLLTENPPKEALFNTYTA